MKSVKIIFIALEIAMIVGVFMTTWCVDWNEARDGQWMYKVLNVLCAINAIIFHDEQQKIEWDEE